MTLANDPTDANHDYVYVVPISSTYLEENTGTPVSPSSPTFIYPTTGYTAGGTWSGIALSNSGDAVVVVSPTNLSTAYHSITFGLTINPPLQSPTVQMANVSGGHNCYLSNNGYTSATNYSIGLAGVNETPGAPNSAANATWINSMRVQVAGGGSITNIIASICQGQTYSFNGSNFSTSIIDTAIFPVLGGCDSMSILHLTVNPIPVVTAGSNSPLCAGSILNLTATNVIGATYQWAGPNLFSSSSQNPSITNITTANAGTYTLTATVNGCTSEPSDVLVVITNAPVAPTASSNSPVCAGNNILLTASGIANAQYNWTGPNTFASNLQNPIITAAGVINAGTYSVTASINGCTSPVTTVNVIVAATAAAPTTNSNSPTCTGQSINLTATATGATSYSWTGPNGFTSNVQSPTITNVTQADAGIYSVIATVNGCPSLVGTVTVVVNKQPSQPDVGSNSPVCLGNDIDLTTSSVAGATYSWAGPNTYNNNSQNPIITPSTLANAGTYTITLTVPGCLPVSNTTNVSVVLPPTITFNTTRTSICHWDTLHIHTSIFPSGVYTYNWTPSWQIDFSNIPDPTFTGNSSTTLVLTVTDSAHCSATDSIKLSVTIPDHLNLNDTTICPNDTIQLHAISINGINSIRWTPDIYISDTTVASPYIWPITNIHYTVYSVDMSGCKDTTGINVRIVPAAVINLPDSAVIYPGENYMLHPSGNCMYFSWTPSLGLSNNNISDPIASPEISTKYYVIGTTSAGCTSTDSIDIIFSPESYIDIPNAFTPGNGPNSKLKVTHNGLVSLKSFSIYNRWGNKVFETTDIDEGWNGDYKGEPQPLGVYVYIVESYTATGRTFNKHGNVTLIR